MALSLSADPEAIAQQLGNDFAPATIGGIVQGGRHPLGTRAVDQFGNVYRYAYAGAVALVAGNWIQAPAEIANHQALVVTSDAAIGATSVTVTLGATLATANQYAGGWLGISLTPGNGFKYQIASHPAAAQSATLVLTLAQPLEVAITNAGSTAELMANPYNGVIQNPVTTLTGACVGVATSTTPINNYTWLQTHGPAPALVKGTTAAGLAVVVPGTAAGACVIDGAASATPIVGHMMEAAVDAKNKFVFVRLE